MSYTERVDKFLDFLLDCVDPDSLLSLEFIQAVVEDNFPTEGNAWITCILTGNTKFPVEVIELSMLELIGEIQNGNGDVISIYN